MHLIKVLVAKNAKNNSIKNFTCLFHQQLSFSSLIPNPRTVERTGIQ